VADHIEVAKTGRASCRSCKKPIGKGELRLGEEQQNLFGEGPSYGWHHLACAARKRPLALERALASFEGEVPGRAELEREIAAARDTARPTALPHVERSPSGRARCQVCREPIEKGALRLAVERAVDAGGAMAVAAASYLHLGCAQAHFADPAARAEARARALENSPQLGEPERREVEAALA
jgi:poly [ADP-ribose] polymerase